MHKTAIEKNGTTDFEVERPWNTIFQLAVYDKDFWTEHFIESANKVSDTKEEVGEEAPIAGPAARKPSTVDQPVWVRDSVAPGPPPAPPCHMLLPVVVSVVLVSLGPTTSMTAAT